MEAAKSHQVLKGAIDAWFKTIEGVTLDIIKSFKENETYEDYLQLVYSNVFKIGCGRTYYKKTVFIACFYVESSPSVGYSIYNMTGYPCTQCLGEFCNSKYRGLCGEDKDDDGWEPPFVMDESSRIDTSLSRFILWGVFGVVSELKLI